MRSIILLFLMITGSFLTAAQPKPKDSTYTKPLWLREVPRYDAVLDFGFMEPVGSYADVARSGLNIGVGLEYHATRNLGISFSGRYMFQDFGFASFEAGDGGGDAHKNFAVAAGPLVSLPMGRFQLDAYGRGGLFFLNTPEQIAVADGQGSNVLSLPDRSSSTATYLDAGVRFIYYFRTNVQLFFSPGIMTTLDEPLVYLQVDDSGASSRFSENVTNMTFNLGLKISLGRRYSNGEMLTD